MSTRPVDPVTREPAQLSPTQERALLPSFSRANPNQAAMERYYNPFYGPQQDTYKLGEKIRDGVMAPNGLGRILDKGPLAGAATLGLGGAALGAGIGASADWLTGGQGTAKRLAWILGLGGAGIGAYSGHLRTKKASFRTGLGADPHKELLEELSQSNMEFNQRMQAMAAIPKLTDGEANSLLQSVAMAGGAGAGAIIARFLFNAGLMGTVIGGFLGGMFGRSLAQPQNRNAMGNPSLSGFDMDGRRLF